MLSYQSVCVMVHICTLARELILIFIYLSYIYIQPHQGGAHVNIMCVSIMRGGVFEGGAHTHKRLTIASIFVVSIQRFKQTYALINHCLGISVNTFAYVS